MSGTSESIASWQWKRVEPFFCWRQWSCRILLALSRLLSCSGCLSRRMYQECATASKPKERERDATFLQRLPTKDQIGSTGGRQQPASQPKCGSVMSVPSAGQQRQRQHQSSQATTTASETSNNGAITIKINRQKDHEEEEEEDEEENGTVEPK